LVDVGRYFELRHPHLRGRRPVRADRRSRADEKRIRAQSTILKKTSPKPRLLFSITAFSSRMRFSSVKKRRLARRARNDRPGACGED
jgi:hypothetical protein